MRLSVSVICDSVVIRCFTTFTIDSFVENWPLIKFCVLNRWKCCKRFILTQFYPKEYELYKWFKVVRDLHRSGHPLTNKTNENVVKEMVLRNQNSSSWTKHGDVFGHEMHQTQTCSKELNFWQTNMENQLLNTYFPDSLLTSSSGNTYDEE